jgi:hypothetical protein
MRRALLPRSAGAHRRPRGQEPQWYLQADGRLDMAKLLNAFQAFFREHSEHWLARFDYQEAGPQLLLQAFLQRIVNGGGRIEREYGLGRMRTDLLLRWPYANEQVQTVVLELKLPAQGPRANHLSRSGADLRLRRSRRRRRGPPDHLRPPPTALAGQAVSARRDPARAADSGVGDVDCGVDGTRRGCWCISGP